MRLSIFAVFFCVSSALAQQPIPDVNIVNGSESPVPVSGKIDAAVVGSISVDDVPDELTDRLDLVLDRLDDLVTAKPSGPQIADFVRSRRIVVDNSGTTEYQLEQRVAVSALTISAENDKLIFAACENIAQTCFGNESIDGSIRVGSEDQQFPGVIVMNFPNPIPVQKFRFVCKNGGDVAGNCEIYLSVVGMVLE